MIVYRQLKTIETDLGFSAKTLYGLTNNIQAHYHKVSIPKRDGTKRTLFVPDFILKQVQKSIASRILSQYPISRYATAYVAGGSVRKNAYHHIGKKKLLKLDIDGFFDHISYSRVKDIVFYEKKFAESIRILLTLLCYFDDRLPQGAPTSPAITNILMYDFDETVGEFCRQRGISYTRYSDDMTFSGDFDAAEVKEFVKAELLKLGLFLKNKKTTIVPNCARQTVTGVVVNQKMNLAKQYKRKVRQEVHYLLKYGADEHLHRIGQDNQRKYFNRLNAKIAYVLHVCGKSKEFLSYKEALLAIRKQERCNGKSF